MIEKLQEDLQKAFKMMSHNWSKQTDNADSLTNFIYKIESLDKLLEYVKNDSEVDLNYALHRWYNFMTSIACENIFIENGCKKETDSNNKYIDFYFKGIPYDLKLTVYPKKFNSDLSLKTREGKNELINWLYNNQSTEQRFHVANRLFIVCVDNSNNYQNSMLLKSRFDLIAPKIKSFIEYYKENELNNFSLKINEKEVSVFADIIVVDNEN